MLVLRGTKKLRDRLVGTVAGADDTSSTVLGDWFATALFWKPQVALLVNERTLLPVFMPLAPASTLLTRLPEAIATALRHQGASEEFVTSELAAMGDVRIAPTNSRSVLGVMNEFAFLGEALRRRDLDDLEVLSARMASMILRPLDGRGGSPDRALADLLGSALSNVIQFPQRTVAEHPAPTSTGRSAATVLQLKVTLLGTKPPVWRRVLVRDSTPLDTLHEVIQAAFGWWNYHLYEFEISGTRYGVPDPDWDFGPPTHDAHRKRLNQVADVGSSFRYSYDFGDGWEHKVTVEKSVSPSGLTLPACIDGRRACPPEDCGGPWGYQELLAIVADPSHPEHDERVEWLAGMAGGPFDPEAFDPGEFVDNLANIRHAVFDD